MTGDRDPADRDALGVYLTALGTAAPHSRGEEQRLFEALGQVERALRASLLESPTAIPWILGLGRELAEGKLRPNEISARAGRADFDEEAEQKRLLGSFEHLAKLGINDVVGAIVELALNRRAVLRLAQAFLKEPPNAAGKERPEFEGVAALVARAEQIKEELLVANLRLVLHEAKRYAGRGVPLLDLVQEGNLGLLKAIEGFEVERGNRLATYAIWWIRQAIRHALAEQSHTIRVPRHLLETLGTVQRFARRHLLEQGRQPTAEEASKALALPLEAVQRALEAIRSTVSYDAPLSDDGQIDLGDVLADQDAADPSEYLLDKDFARQAQAALSGLEEDERRALELRFGIGGEGEHSVEEAADRLGLTRERMRELEARAIRKLQRTKIARSLRVFVRD